MVAVEMTLLFKNSWLPHSRRFNKNSCSFSSFTAAFKRIVQITEIDISTCLVVKDAKIKGERGEVLLFICY